MNHIIKNNIDKIKELCEQYDIKYMYIFGSVCTDDFKDHSDVDILISFKDISIEKYTDNYFDLLDDLENLLGRKVDLMTDKSLSNPYLIQSIEATRELLYAA